LASLYEIQIALKILVKYRKISMMALTFKIVNSVINGRMLEFY
jgi:hypothetical protein